MGTLVGKIALVTGGGRGIGRAIAQRLAGDGARVGIHFGHDEGAAMETMTSIIAAGGDAFTLHADFLQPDAAEVLLREVRTQTGTLDILINNAGLGDLRKPVPDVTAEDLDRLFTVNVKAPFLVTQALLPMLNRGGRVINLSSNLTRSGAEGYLAAYAMSKAAIDAFTLALAKELGPRAITVNAVAPGVVDTEMNVGWLRHDESRRFVSSLSPLGRVAEPRDIAGVVAFLASGDGGWLTGQWIEASGGAGL